MLGDADPAVALTAKTARMTSGRVIVQGVLLGMFGFLRARFAQEGQRDLAHGVEGGQEGGQRQGDEDHHSAHGQTHPPGFHPSTRSQR